MKRTKRDAQDEAKRIRELFLSPREDYSPSDAARLTDNDPAELERLIAKGHLEARTLYLLAKPAVLRLALDQWPLETIFRALGTDAKEILPPLLRLERLDLKVPGYVIRVIEYAAEQEGKTVSNLLRQLLHDYAVSVRMRTSDDMDEEMPDVMEAMFYPDKPPR
jgi:hypothetical protein